MGSLALSNPQHEEFVLEYLFGGAKGNAARSYANVYHDGQMVPSCYSSASKLLSRDDVGQYISVRMEEHKKLAEYRRIHNTEILSDIIDEMSSADGGTDVNGNPNSVHLQRQTAIRAISEQNKMLGLNEEKANINVEGGMNFTFNLIPPSDSEDQEKEDAVAAIRKKHGDVDAEDIEFEELGEEDDDNF
jgi:hypothetical protein